MDPFSLAFYAAVCGTLSVAAPKLGSFLPRLAIGAVVGVVAATVLPMLHSLVPGY